MPYEEIVAPPSGTEVAFGEPITVEGHAWRVARDGSKQPADTKIVWRHESGGGYAASGPNVTLTFTNRQNTNVAMYAGKSNIVDRVKLNVVCGAIEEVARTQKNTRVGRPVRARTDHGRGSRFEGKPR